MSHLLPKRNEEEPLSSRSHIADVDSDPLPSGSISMKEEDKAGFLFNQLASEWKEQTSHYAMLKKRYSHPAYQKVIELGCSIVPHILKRLEKSPDWWFMALRKITNENPAEENSSFEEAVTLWLEWGQKKGLI
ncbi:MAG: hypothetical protein H7Y37_09090 [Anaerolineae bacterium]|nr:hypothetical protein [Gloeobacterales cyanobacterium ES-bin-313]